MKASERRGIVALHTFCHAWVSSCVRGVPQVKGESHDITKRYLAQIFYEFDSQKTLYILMACSNRPRFSLWFSENNVQLRPHLQPFQKFGWMLSVGIPLLGIPALLITTSKHIAPLQFLCMRTVCLAAKFTTTRSKKILASFVHP